VLLWNKLRYYYNLLYKQTNKKFRTNLVFSKYIFWRISFLTRGRIFSHAGYELVLSWARSITEKQLKSSFLAVNELVPNMTKNTTSEKVKKNIYRYYVIPMFLINYPPLDTFQDFATFMSQNLKSSFQTHDVI